MWIWSLGSFRNTKIELKIIPYDFTQGTLKDSSGDWRSKIKVTAKSGFPESLLLDLQKCPYVLFCELPLVVLLFSWCFWPHRALITSVKALCLPPRSHWHWGFNTWILGKHFGQLQWLLGFWSIALLEINLVVKSIVKKKIAEIS